MIEVAFRNLLINDTAVKAIVWDVPTAPARMYFKVRPQNEFRPSIVLSLVSSVPGFQLDGKAGYASGRMQLDCLAPTYPAAKELAAAVRKAIDGFTGVSDGTVIDFIETENARDMPAVALQGSGLPATFGVTIDAHFQVSD